MTEKQVAKIDTEIAKAFDVDILEVQNMVKEYQTLTLVPDDPDTYKICRKALTACVRTRTGIDKRRLELNSEDQEKIKGRNSAAKDLALLIAPAEDHLSGLVKGEDARIAAIEVEKEEAEKAKIQGRVDALLKFGVTMDYFDVASMSDDEFENTRQKSEEAWAAEQARIQEEVLEKAEKEIAEKAEREAEVQRLADEKARLEKWDAEQKAKEVALRAEQEKVRLEQEATAAKLKAAQDKIDAEKKAIQAAKDAEALKIKLAAEAKIKAETDAKEAAEKAAEAEKQAALEAERIEALKPDKEKLLMFADKIKDLTAGNLSVESKEARLLFSKALDWIMAVEKTLRDEIKEL